MDRLTKKSDYGMYFYPECFNDECSGIGTNEKCEVCKFNYEICKKLGEYEDLEEQGMLIKLPCKHKEDYCTECKHGELFERKNVSEPKQISVSNGNEYCGHCGYLCEYARGYKRFYCIRCGGLNLRSWKN